MSYVVYLCLMMCVCGDIRCVFVFDDVCVVIYVVYLCLMMCVCGDIITLCFVCLSELIHPCSHIMHPACTHIFFLFVFLNSFHLIVLYNIMEIKKKNGNQLMG